MTLKTRNYEYQIEVMFSGVNGTHLTHLTRWWHHIIMGLFMHDDGIKWKHFPRYWPFVRGIPRSTVNSPHKAQWRGALMFSFICVWINGWVNTSEAGDLRRYRVRCDVILMWLGTHARGLVQYWWSCYTMKMVGTVEHYDIALALVKTTTRLYGLSHAKAKT